MGSKLYDFIDRRDRNLVEMWLEGLPKDICGRLSAKLQSLVSAEPDLLPGAITDTRERSIKEIVVNGKSGAFRLFFCRGTTNPRSELTLLCGGQEKDRKYIGTNPSDAERHRQELIQNIGTRREHKYFKFLG